MSSRILVVDDQPAVREIITLHLAETGHTVDCAGDGREAIAKIKDSRFDLIITDQIMPYISGEQLAAMVGSIAPGTPVIMLTGLADLHESAEGVTTVLPKPITRQALLAAVAAALKPR